MRRCITVNRACLSRAVSAAGVAARKIGADSSLDLACPRVFDEHDHCTISFMEFPAENAADVGAQRDPNLFVPAGIRVFDIGLEALDLALSTDPVRTGRTIARLDDLRLTLMSLKSGATIMPHKTDHEISIQTISGRVVIHTAQAQVDLPSGRIAVLNRDTVHDITALVDSAILITVSISSHPPFGVRRED